MANSTELQAVLRMAAQAVDQTMWGHPAGLNESRPLVLSQPYVIGFANAVIDAVTGEALEEQPDREARNRLRTGTYPLITHPMREALEQFTNELEDSDSLRFREGLRDGWLYSKAVVGDLREIPLSQLRAAVETASALSAKDEPTHSAVAAALLNNTLHKYITDRSARDWSQTTVDAVKGDKAPGSQAYAQLPINARRPADAASVEGAQRHQPKAIQFGSIDRLSSTWPHNVFFAILVASVAAMFLSDNAPGGAYLGLTAAMLLDFPTLLFAVPPALAVRPYRRFIAIVLVVAFIAATYRISNMDASTAASVDRRTWYFMAQLTAVLILAHAVNLLHHLPWRSTSRPPRY